MTFIVRVQESGPSQMAGTVERLRSGETQPFRGVEELAGLIARAVQAARAEAERETS